MVPSTSEDVDSHVFHQYTLRILNADRNALIQHLQDQHIPCAIYYPIPLHRQKAYANPRYKEKDFRVTNQLIDQVISLPMHTELDNEQQDFIIQKLLGFLNS